MSQTHAHPNFQSTDDLKLPKNKCNFEHLKSPETPTPKTDIYEDEDVLTSAPFEDQRQSTADTLAKKTDEELRADLESARLELEKNNVESKIPALIPEEPVESEDKEEILELSDDDIEIIEEETMSLEEQKAREEEAAQLLGSPLKVVEGIKPKRKPPELKTSPIERTHTTPRETRPEMPENSIEIEKSFKEEIDKTNKSEQLITSLIELAENSELKGLVENIEITPDNKIKFTLENGNPYDVPLTLLLEKKVKPERIFEVIQEKEAQKQKKEKIKATPEYQRQVISDTANVSEKTAELEAPLKLNTDDLIEHIRNQYGVIVNRGGKIKRSWKRLYVLL